MSGAMVDALEYPGWPPAISSEEAGHPAQCRYLRHPMTPKKIARRLHVGTKALPFVTDHRMKYMRSFQEKC